MKGKLVLLYCGLGNLLELYDFTLFAVLVTIIAPHFFVGHGDPLILGYIAFAITFLIAPFGAIVWGYVGDKYGSDKIFKFPLLLMALSSLMISFLPTYDSIGEFAPIALLILRIFQGISASGEVLGAKIYAFEKTDADASLTASAFISSMGALGVLFAVISGYFITSLPDITWQWRIPFMIGSMGIFLLFILRVFQSSSNLNVSRSISASSIINVLRENSKVTIKTLTASGLLGVFSYYLHSYIISFQITKLEYPSYFAYQNVGLSLFATATTALIFAYKVLNKSLEINRLLLSSIIIIVPQAFITHVLMLMKIDILTYICFILLGSSLAIYASVSGVYLIKSFSTEAKCRGALFVNALGVGVFGGSTPLIMTFAANIHSMLPGAILSAVFLLGFIILKS